MKASMPGLLVAGMLLAPPTHAAELPAGVVGKLDGRVAISVAFSPDGKMLATGGNYNIELWDAASGKRLRELTGHDAPVYSVAFSPDSKLLASGGGDRTVRLWDVPTGDEVSQLKGHGEEIRSVAFSPDGKLLAVGSMNRGIRLWNPETGEELRLLPGHKSLVYSVAFSPDGRTLASGSHDNTVRLWDVATGKQWCALEHLNAPVYFVAFSRDGRTLAATSIDGEIALYEAVSQKHIRTLIGAKALQRASFAFSPDGKTIAAAGGIFTVLLRDRAAQKPPGGAALSARELESLWSDLLGSDAGKADEAIWTLVRAPEQSVKSLNDWLKPVPFDAKKVAKLVADLDSDEFATRERASEELARLGAQAEPALQRALEGNPSLEVKQRVEALLQRLERSAASPAVCREVRAVAVLELIGTKESRELLARLAGDGYEARLTQEAKAALARLGDSP